MSYDGWLEIDTGGSEAAQVAEIGNYTSNVSPMWQKALTQVQGHPFSLRDTDGMCAAVAGPVLAAAAAHMGSHPNEYIPLIPANGFGNVEGARNFLSDAADMCAAHPKATLRWSC